MKIIMSEDKWFQRGSEVFDLFEGRSGALQMATREATLNTHHLDANDCQQLIHLHVVHQQAYSGRGEVKQH